jgi:hypothetical protein
MGAAVLTVRELAASTPPPEEAVNVAPTFRMKKKIATLATTLAP